MEFKVGNLTVWKTDAAASPAASPAPQPPKAPEPPSDTVITRDDGSSVSIKDGTIAIQGSSKHHKNMSDSGLSDAVPIVAIVFCFGWLSIKAIVNAVAGRGSNRQAMRLSAEEQATVEKLQRTLAQMESRVESLETILVEARRSKESYGTKF